MRSVVNAKFETVLLLIKLLQTFFKGNIKPVCMQMFDK